jgi:integrase
MPTVYKRYGKRNGKRYAYYAVLIRRDGHPPIYKSFAEGVSHQEAMEWAKEEERKQDLRDVPTLMRRQYKDVTLESLFRGYKQHRSSPWNWHKRKKTFDNEEIVIKAFSTRRPDLWKKPILSLKRRDIQDYVDAQLGEGILSSTIRRNFVSPLRHLINKYARIDLEYQLPDPFYGLEIPEKPPHRKRVLSQAEQLTLFVSIIDGCRGKHQQLLWFSIVRLALNTALRLKPLLNLKWKDVKFEERKLWAYPTKKEPEGRWLPLSLETCHFLKRYFEKLSEDKRQSDAHVFPMTKSAHESAWKRIIARAKLYEEIEVQNWKNGQKLKDWLHFHDLRHTALTRFRSTRNGGVGLDGDQNAYMAGHIDERMTATYEHHWDDLIADIRDKLDAADEVWKPENVANAWKKGVLADGTELAVLPPESIAALKAFDDGTEWECLGIAMWPNEHKVWEEAKKGLWQHQV